MFSYQLLIPDDTIVPPPRHYNLRRELDRLPRSFSLRTGSMMQEVVVNEAFLDFFCPLAGSKFILIFSLLFSLSESLGR